jgi:hypothetical protein
MFGQFAGQFEKHCKKFRIKKIKILKQPNISPPPISNVAV